MRYYELETCPSVRFARPMSLAEPFRANVRICIRVMPSVYRWLDLELQPGAREALIGLQGASVAFPEPYDANGVLSGACRHWIIMAAREAAHEFGYAFAVVFGPEDVVTALPSGELIISEVPPSGGLLI